jgi:hypothetical protein
MKSFIAFLIFSLLFSITSCSWYNEGDDEPRRTSCIQPGLYDYLESDWPVSICTTEICSIYTAVWKELFMKQNNMTEEYFSKHITIIHSETTPPENEGGRFHISYRVQNGWAIATGGDGFIIRIAESNTRYPEIGLPRGTYLTLAEIESALDHGGFSSKIHKAPKTGPLRYSSMHEALDSLIEAACVDTMCFSRVFLSLHIGTLTMEAYAAYEDEENGCIIGTIDLITGYKSVKDVLCDEVYSP